MKNDHPNLKVEELHPGYFVVTYTPQSFATDGGTVCPPGICIIPREIPADFLRALADEKDGLKVEKTSGLTLTQIVNAKDALEGGNETPLIARILNVLAEGNIRTGDLADRLGVTSCDIKALDGTSEEFHIGHGGWVKLGKKEGEA